MGTPPRYCRRVVEGQSSTGPARQGVAGAGLHVPAPPLLRCPLGTVGGGGAEMAFMVYTQAQEIRLKFSALLGCPFPILCTEEHRFFRGANFCLVAGFSSATPRIHRTQERRKKQPRTSGPGCYWSPKVARQPACPPALSPLGGD